MKKVEAPTLEEAYQKAAEQLSCSITELKCEVIQYPTKGILGFMKRGAIIVAAYNEALRAEVAPQATTQETAPTPPRQVRTTPTPKPTPTPQERTPTPRPTVSQKPQESLEQKVKDSSVLEGFFDVDSAEEEAKEEKIVYDELALLIEQQLKELLSHSCFDIDVVEVDVVDNTALIFIDGEDAALLIGKEGYRYNALSYMLFNWLHAKYELFIKLEIAEFLTSQQEMIRNYIKPVIENVQKYGKGKTRPLDGILVQIALEQLREEFPDKYVAVKTSRDGNRFVVINEFNRR